MDFTESIKDEDIRDLLDMVSEGDYQAIEIYKVILSERI